MCTELCDDALPGSVSGDPVWLAAAHEDTQAVYRYWDAKRGNRRMPARADLDPTELVPYLPTIILVDVRPGRSITGGPVYVYRLVGTAEVAVRGKDPTGQPVETHGFGLALIEVVRNYDQVVNSRAPWFDGAETLLTEQDIRDGESMFLPLSADGENVDMILVFSIQEKLIKSFD